MEVCVPDPSRITVTTSDAASWTIEVQDIEGISHVDLQYGKLPSTIAWREMASDCPNSLTIKVLKERKFFFRKMPLYSVEVCDCSALENGEFVVSHFKIGKDDTATPWVRPHTRTPDTQRLIDSAEMQAQNAEWQRAMMRPILLVLLLILVLLVLNLWAGLGPLWSG